MNTDITELSLDQLDQIFQDTPNAIPTADSLSVGTEQTVNPLGGSGSIQGLEDAPADLFDEKTDEPAEVTDPEVTVDDKATTDEPEPPVEPKAEIAAESSELLSNTLEYLIKEGYWEDFEGREDLEMTNEMWAELSTKQAQHAAYAMFNELVDESGYFGKAIISHIKEGGDPNEIIDLFKEQKSVEAIDVSTEQGKQSKIEAYYTDVLNWKPERVKRHINRIVESDEIDEEFETVDEAYKQHFADKVEETNHRQKEIQQKQVDKQKAFVGSIKDTLDSNTVLTAREKQVIASSILDFRHKLDNGQKVNDFYVKFAEVQTDPKEYVELVQFIMDKKGYLDRLNKKAETKANRKAFDFIKGNSAVSKPKAQDISINTASKKGGTDFSFFAKK